VSVGTPPERAVIADEGRIPRPWYLIEASDELESTTRRQIPAPHVFEVEPLVELGEVADEGNARLVVLVDNL
jgi:hypothetical protein